MEKFWESKIGKLVRRISAMEIPVHAANACYFMVLAVFPTLVLMLGLLRYTSMQPRDLMDLMAGFLPVALQPYV